MEGNIFSSFLFLFSHFSNTRDFFSLSEFALETLNADGDIYCNNF